MDKEEARRVDRRRTFTVREVVARDLRARHSDGNGVTYVWERDHGLATVAERGITILVTNSRRLPQCGWHEAESMTRR